MNIVSVKLATLKSVTPVATRTTSRSYVNGPGGVATDTGRHLSVGSAVSMTIPAGLLSVVSVAHGGTTTGPMRPLVAVSPVAAVASTRQKNAPDFSAIAGESVSAVSTVSRIGDARVLSLLTRSRYRTGSAELGTVPTVHENVGEIVVKVPADGSGVVTVTPAGNTAAAATSGRPQP